jgi:hypothetical protein
MAAIRLIFRCDPGLQEANDPFTNSKVYLKQGCEVKRGRVLEGIQVSRIMPMWLRTAASLCRSPPDWINARGCR